MKHILLTGFKHVGKTSIGKKLAELIEKPFIDLDQKIEAKQREIDALQKKSDSYNFDEIIGRRGT